MKQKYILYMLFAGICTLINLGSQFLMGIWLSGIKLLQFEILSFKIHFILKLGTGILLGFLAKFILDKFVVFKDKYESTAATAKQLIIYGLFALFTTIIFLFFEISLCVFKSNYGSGGWVYRFGDWVYGIIFWIKNVFV
jgi:hypothetical protein